MIVSDVRIEVGSLEIKIIAPCALIPFVSYVNPCTQ
jgi:hypothetical protein